MLTQTKISRLRSNISDGIPFSIPKKDSELDYINYLSEEGTYPIGSYDNFEDIVSANLLILPSQKSEKPPVRAVKHDRLEDEPMMSYSVEVGGKKVPAFKPTKSHNPIYVEIPTSSFKKLGDITKIVERRLDMNMARHVPTKISPWINNDEVVSRFKEVIDRLLTIDTRFGSLFVDADYNQLNAGVFSPGKEIRDEYQLAPSLKDDKQTVGGETFSSLYYECINVWCDLWLAGVKLSYPNVDALKNAAIAVSLRRHVMMGYMSGGSREISDLHNLIDEFEKHPGGTFLYSSTPDVVTNGVRRQLANGVYDPKTREFVSKKRKTSLMAKDHTGETFIGINTDLISDGKIGQRVRWVANISTKKNVPNLQANAILAENITPKMKRILTQKPEMLELHKGSLFYTGDVSKYDNTSLRESRSAIMSKLFSQKMNELWDHMEHDDILICYDQVVDAKTEEIQRKRVVIPRRTSDNAYEQIELLTSGHGLTSIFGKTENPADDIRSLCLLLDVTPTELCQPHYTGDDDLLSWILVNGGDDRGVFFSTLAEITGENENSLRERFVSISESSPVFSVVEEVPGKTTGRLYHTDKDNRLSAVTGDALSLLGNQMVPEFDLTHPNRSNVVIGLAGAIHSYLETCDNKEYYPIMMEVAELTLYIMGYDGTLDELDRDAEEEEARLLNEAMEGTGSVLNEGTAPLLAASILGLANPSQLYHLFTRKELKEKLPPEVFELIWMSVPERLGADFTRFINEKSFAELILKDTYEYPVLSKRYPGLDNVLKLKTSAIKGVSETTSWQQ